MGYLNNSGLTTFSKKIKTWVKEQIAAVQNALNPMVSITYADLKALRDGSKLVAGRRYRITDFVTTSVQTDTRSAGHAFDVIVKADDVNVLNENAKAIQHKGDTYFSGCKLSAWELKYCLDNDTNRFAWADTTNGKGVVWWMKDEWDNECFYDFKNIQYKIYAVDETDPLWEKMQDYYDNEMDVPYHLSANMNNMKKTTSFIYAYTFSLVDGQETSYDASVIGLKGDDDIYTTIPNNNIIKENFETFIKDDEDIISRLSLNFIFFIPFFSEDYLASNYQVYGNKIGINSHDMGFGRKCFSNSFGNSCYNNSFGNECYNNSFGNSCYKNSFGNDCRSNSFGNDCDSNSFGKGCSSNSFGNDCFYNSFGNNCYKNSFGNNCFSNSFGNDCFSNSFGNFCSSNSFGNSCFSNSFGNSCGSNSFGNNCFYNSFGNSCGSNSFGNECFSNSFGNSCYNNSFGNKCYKNSFGNDCYYNSFGNGTIVDAQFNYIQYIHVDNGVRYVQLLFNEQATKPSSSAPLQNLTIKSGIKGTDISKKLTIDCSSIALGADYEWIIAKNSNGEIKQYCEADLIN